MAAHQILVIEARGWIAELLYRAGFDSTSVKSFGDLLHRFYSEPSPEVIVGDALLLTEEAFYVCENMKTMQPNLPIFIIDDENMRIESESDAYFYSVRETDFFIEKIKEILYVNDELIDLSGMESEAVLPIPPEPISEFDALDFDDFQYSSKSNTQRLPDVSIQKKNENFHQEIISPNDANHDFTQIPTERRINSELNSNILALEDDNLDVLESLDLFNHTNVLSGHDENHAIGLIDDSNEDLFLSEEVLFSTEIQPENIGFKSNNSLGLYQKHLIEEDDSLSLDQLSYEFTAMYSSVSYEPQGYYGNLSFPEILYQCFSGHFTGRLLLKRNAIIREIYFSHGSPLDAETNLLKDSIAYILLQDKKIDEYTYQKIVAERRLDPNSRFLDLIKKEGILSDLELDEAKKQQTKNILLSCFSWSNASYGMNYDPEIQKRAQSAQPLNLLPIIFEGIKTAQPVELLARHFDNYMRCPVESSPRLNDYAMMLRAFSDDLKLASLFDGTRPLGEILARAPLGLIDALRIIRALEITSCITFGEALTPDVLESVQRRGRAASSSGRPPQGRPAQAGSVGRPQRPMATRPKLERRSQPASVRPAPAAPPKRRAAMSLQIENLEDFIHLKFGEMNNKNYYDFLEINIDSSLAQIKERYDFFIKNLNNTPQLGNIPLIEKADKISKYLAIVLDVLSHKDKKEKYFALNMDICEFTGLDVVLAERNHKYGKICIQNADFEKAFKFFQLSSQQDPHQPLYRAYQSYCEIVIVGRTDKKKRNELFEVLKTTLQEDETLDEIAVLIAHVYRDTGNADLAIRFYQRALGLNAHNREARRALSNLSDDDDDQADQGSLFGRLFSKPKR